MTISKDGVAVMYSLVEENFDTLVKETSLPREMWEQAALYDKSAGLPPSKVYVVPNSTETAKVFRDCVVQLDPPFHDYPEELIVRRDITEEQAAIIVGSPLGRHHHYFLADIYMDTEVKN